MAGNISTAVRRECLVSALLQPAAPGCFDYAVTCAPTPLNMTTVEVDLDWTVGLVRGMIFLAAFLLRMLGKHSLVASRVVFWMTAALGFA